MGIMVYSLLWVMQDLYHQPLRPSVQPKVETWCLVFLTVHGILALAKVASVP